MHIHLLARLLLGHHLLALCVCLHHVNSLHSGLVFVLLTRLVQAKLQTLHSRLLAILLHRLVHAGLHHVKLLTILLHRLVHAGLHHVKLLTILLHRLVHTGLYHVRLLTVRLHRLIHAGLHHIWLLTVLLTELLAILHLALVHRSHLSLHSSLNWHHQYVSSHLVSNLIGHHFNSASHIKRSKVNTTNSVIKMSDLNPLLPATRQTHPLNWEFYMPNQRLPWAFFVSDFESKLLV